MRIAEDTDQVEQKSVTPPNREEVITWYKEQIEMARYRFELAELLSKTAQEDAKRVQALAIMAQLQASPKASQEQTHTVTQEDLDNNPELVKQGVKVGEVITVGGPIDPTPES